MDVSRALRSAEAAARRGDVIGLETQLVRLRTLGDSVVGLDTRLRELARAVREHPSFKDVPKLRAV